MIEKKEVRFEEDIETSMLKQGWKSEPFQEIGYDAKLGLCPQKLLHFIQATQEKAWQKFERNYGARAQEVFFKCFDHEVQQRGLLDVLRYGIKDRDVTLKPLIFKPVSTLNETVLHQYQQNEFTLVRQFAYSAFHHNTLDLVLMINGLPLVALELKNQYTQQNVEHAKQQWMHDRDSREKVFQWNQRFLVYFALDHLEVAMTTKLAGEKTYFLPFNQGSQGAGKVGGAGNPIPEFGYATAYLWEEVLTPDSLLDIIQHYMNVDGDKLIFPRYHQLDVVKKLSATVQAEGSGHNYLIQHSAGSGKSNSIAWLAYHLTELTTENHEPLFHSVIVVTDRTVLDRQLQKTITNFDHTPGFVTTIGEHKTAKDLKKAIRDGNKIIITTLQKFPVIYDELYVGEQRRFAIIVDEAHSSQSGTSAQKMKMGLGDISEAKAEYEAQENLFVDAEDVLVQELLHQGQHTNLSFFAFTATPKKKTLELFGTKTERGQYEPFHTYSMRQAIEEGFILDVLRNYMTYEESWKISKAIMDNPKLETTEATKAITQYKESHRGVIQEKAKIIVEQVQTHTIHTIHGQGKAMLVTASRQQAVRYMQEISRLVKEKGYAWRPLVAFSGTVEDGEQEYTEASMNQTMDGKLIQENQLKEVFHEAPYRLLIVAEKYQTGFDEPLLQTMFVNKKLRDVKAVQTLSRLNRIAPGKTDTFVLDFVNTREEIQEAFQPYYEQTILENGVDVQLLYDLQSVLHRSKVYTEDDIEKVVQLLVRNTAQDEYCLGILTSIYQTVMQRYELQLTTEEEKASFRKNVRNFVKWYTYIAQLHRNFDRKLLEEKLFLEQLIRFFPTNIKEKINIEDKIQLEYYRLRADQQESIELLSSEGTVYNPTRVGGKASRVEKKWTPLEEIIDKVNAQFPGDFNEQDRMAISDLNQFFVEETPQKIEHLAQENTRQMFEEKFKEECQNKVIDLYTKGNLASDKLMYNESFLETVFQFLSDAVWQKTRS